MAICGLLRLRVLAIIKILWRIVPVGSDILPDMSDTDMELLARYTQQGAEDAFAQLVRRHINLVYSAAVRQVRSPQLAEEVTQSAFIDLARNAARLKHHTILSAWLYQVTRRTAIDVVRREASRQLREQIATELNSMNATAADWTRIEPLLDEAMHALNDTDRAAVLLRYFENKSLREVGAALGTSENAAQKRLSRAVERLREFFAKRGVTVGASVVAVISANAIQASPASLAQFVSFGAIAEGATANVSALTVIKGPLRLMASKKMKFSIVALLLALLAGLTLVTELKIFRPSSTPSAPSIEGTWEGAQDFPEIPGISKGEHATTRVVLRFLKTNGAYSATVGLIDSRTEPFRATIIAYTYPSLRFDVSPGQWYEGTLSRDATEILGTVHTKTGSLPLSLKRTATPSPAHTPVADHDCLPRAGSALQGRWEGILSNGPDSLRLVVKISEPSSGTFHAHLDTLAKGDNGPWLGQPLLVSCRGREVELLVASRAGMFEGTLNEDASEMVGNWLQGGWKFPSRFWRADQ